MGENESIRIALTGKMRSGKSTFARELSLYHGFQTISFGGSLKSYADKLFAYSDVYPIEEITREGVFGTEVVSSKKPRKLYQDFGQIMRQLDPNIWVQHAGSSMEVWEDSRSTKGIVIDDLRQPNEFEWCRKNGFIIIRVVTDEDSRVDRIKREGDAFVVGDLKHDTEMHSDNFEVDYEIVNNGSYDEFMADIEHLISEIMASVEYEHNS